MNRMRKGNGTTEPSEDVSSSVEDIPLKSKLKSEDIIGKKPIVEEYDPYTKVFFIPRSVTFLVLGCFALTYLSHAFDPTRRSTNPLIADREAYLNVKSGIWAMVFVFLGYSAVQGPKTSMIRPHPAVWSLVHGIMTCYLLFVTFLLFQTVDDARNFLKHIYPELGVDLPERAYGEDCSLMLPNGKGINWDVIRSTVWDEFTLAHFLGWWGKALILRDRTMLWTLSILFEFMELTFQHYLPNFNECWWDSWILDVAVCNAGGIALGMATVKYFQAKEYDWRGMSQQPTLVAKAKRSVLQFTPSSFDSFQWSAFSSPLRCLQCLFPLIIILVFEVNHFFLKYELWVPPRNPLNTIRLTIMFLIALPGMKDYYEFIESDSDDVFKKMGSFAWVSIAIAFVETLIVIKFGQGLFNQPWPKSVLTVWGMVLSGLIILFTVWSVNFYVRHGTLRSIKNESSTEADDKKRR